MATIVELNAETRKRSGSAAVRRLRKEGAIPAVLYGRKVETANLKVDGKTFAGIVGHGGSDNILVNLKIEGAKGDQLALVQQVQHDHLKGGILHIDFHAVAMDEEIHASVPVVLAGECEGVKQGGMLEQLLHSLEVRCLPKDLPDAIQIDVTNLNIGSAVHVRELNLPAGVRVPLDGEVLIAMVAEPKVEAEASPAAAAAAAAPAAGAEKK